MTYFSLIANFLTIFNPVRRFSSLILDVVKITLMVVLFLDIFRAPSGDFDRSIFCLERCYSLLKVGF
jgi:hypothetical protein